MDTESTASSKTPTIQEESLSNSSTPFPTNVLDAMDDYYKLKSAYMIRVENSKDTIKKNKKYSLKQKREALRRLVPKCIICNKPVGTVFLNQNRKLIAKCGATSFANSNYEPCNLNIDIYKGAVETKDILYEEQVYNKNISALSIIKLKLDLIFKYISQEETLEKFDSILAEYETESEWVNTFTEEMIKLEQKYKNKSRIDVINKDNKEHFAFIKDALMAYKETKEQIALRDIMDRYVGNIIPNLDELRNLQYDYCEMETDDNVEFTLVKVKNSIESMEHINEEPVVNSNVQ
tara:strand:- start:5425 stop:6300 length:876 start_codon:yes stop_codon:yes gene_type:complete